MPKTGVLLKNSGEVDYDIVVVGGGPAGARVAARAARGGARVLILEEHAMAGEPLQCAGIVSTRVSELTEFDVPVIKKMRTATLFPPDGHPFTITASDVRAHIIDRSEYDRRALKHAEDNGAEVWLSARCTKARASNGMAETTVKKNGQTIRLRSRLVIGADGPNSMVRESIGCSTPVEKLYGVQVHIPGDLLPDKSEHVELHIGSEVAPGFFAWIIPSGDHFRVGLCTNRSPKKYLQRFVSSLGLEYDDGWNVQAGTIPLAYLDKTYGHHTLLVGDAACQVKPLSGGGLYTSIICADICADVALDALDSNRTDEKSLSRYQGLWSAEIGREIRRGLVMRKAYLQMTDRQLNEIVNIFRSDRLRSVLVTLGDIDFPSRAGKAALLKSPKLIKFSPVLLKSLL